MSELLVHTIYANKRGEIGVEPELLAIGRSGNEFWELSAEEMIPLPAGTDLMLLPQRAAVGLDAETGEVSVLSDEDDEPLLAVGAVLPAGYTRTLLPAFEPGKKREVLPLFGYTAVGFVDGEIRVAAIQTDAPEKWNPLYYNDDTLPQRVRRKRRAFSDNRIVKQLAHCSLEYHCCTAQNLFYERWEAGIPVSPVCNADCLGCISRQPSGCCPSPQERISFVPDAREIVEAAVSHLERAPEAIISFGQGCEGEPLLQWRLLEAAIKQIRQATSRGTINMNTNASNPEAISRLAAAGMDSIRVSLISGREETYAAYHRPQGYTLADVEKSLKAAKAGGLFTSINLLVFPGLTDLPSEMEALFEFIGRVELDLVQLRNLNIDPDLLLDRVPLAPESPAGIEEFISELRSRFPRLQIGNFSRPVRG